MRAYFVEQASWEGTMRRQFDALGKRIQQREECQQDVLVALRQLNAWYGTRFKSEDVPRLRDELLGVLWQSDWLLAAPPVLFDLPDDRLPAIVGLVTSVLQRAKAEGMKRPYSLVTKFLHFVFPTTFAIYDSQAAKSIAMWAVFAFDEDDANENATAAPFDEFVLGETGGYGYLAVLRFYRAVWDLSTPEDKAALSAQGKRMEELFCGQPGLGVARVTIVDLIDKLLWQAAGNPFRLGLATPPAAS